MNFRPDFIEIIAADYHRNGVSGMPFNVALVNDANDGQVKVVVMFEASGYTAVLSVSKLMEGDVEFGSNSYRGDLFEEALRPELWPLESGDDVSVMLPEA